MLADSQESLVRLQGERARLVADADAANERAEALRRQVSETRRGADGEVTELEVERERLRAELEKQKDEIAKLKSDLQMAELRRQGGVSAGCKCVVS